MSCVQLVCPAVCTHNAARAVRFLVSVSVFLLLQGAADMWAQFQPTFQHTPIVDGNDAWGPNGLYKGHYPGLLYGHVFDNPGYRHSYDEPQEINNHLKHDTDGKSFASSIVPLCGDGTLNCDPSLRRIAVVALGMSNWSKEVCGNQFIPAGNFQADPTGEWPPPLGPTNLTCGGNPWSFSYKMAQNNQVYNGFRVTFVDCAIIGAVAQWWTIPPPNDPPMPNPPFTGEPPHGMFTNCNNILMSLGLSPSQVQVVLFKQANSGDSHYPALVELPTLNFPGCVNAVPVQGQDSDPCVLIYYVAQTARAIKVAYPKVKQMFVHSRIYGGYADNNVSAQQINPEPYAYEQGFAMKWLIQSQIDEMDNLGFLPAAGSLNYNNNTAPWIDWGVYMWAGQDPDPTHPYHDHPAPCQNCEIQNLTWRQDTLAPSSCTSGQECDLQATDNTHPSDCGRDKVSKMLMHFYCTSLYTTPWFTVSRSPCTNIPQPDNTCAYPQGPP